MAGGTRRQSWVIRYGSGREIFAGYALIMLALKVSRNHREREGAMY